jgi:hypothetical protein
MGMSGRGTRNIARHHATAVNPRSALLPDAFAGGRDSRWCHRPAPSPLPPRVPLRVAVSRCGAGQDGPLPAPRAPRRRTYAGAAIIRPAPCADGLGRPPRRCARRGAGPSVTVAGKPPGCARRRSCSWPRSSGWRPRNDGRIDSCCNRRGVDCLSWGYHVKVPMESLGTGRQKAWLVRAAARVRR